MNLSLGIKMLVVVICTLLSIIIGIVAGLLMHPPAAPKAPAVLFGGGVFGGSLTLCLLVMSSLGVL
ncbi:MULTISPECIES: hypothetical protein [unclassified Streptomyces]|uniref:hypothetical protein n=1 Tax=unclassified Streptomyces TaxID=2593676 RepID=UPI002E80CC2E|nr:hypothetical protein [Streptomyces sp. NBC_00589]WTI35921.1 hypothetical protein OIC96_13385 [Streptomyces sp. NBC_00775]WUB30405.1 hypothetical protein OHA51_36345 [Streptomyces sp. NBC_00589]